MRLFEFIKKLFGKTDDALPDQDVVQVSPKGQQEVINKFCDESSKEDDLLSQDCFKSFAMLSGADGSLSLKGKCFVGINVKTDSQQGMRPIAFYTTDKVDLREAEKNIDGKIPDMENPPKDIRFKWDPKRWKQRTQEAEDIDTVDGEEFVSAAMTENAEIKKFFKSPYGPNYKKAEKKHKYNILGFIYNDVLKLKEPCWVWIWHVDHDLNNKGKLLSFVLAVAEKEEDFKTIYDKRHEILDYIMLVKAWDVRKMERRRQVEAVKSAVAAIMSRNMSHNLGSHYLYYTKNQLETLADKSGKMGPDIRGAAKVLGYMQARMDYLATIVSGDKYPYGCVYFKGQIFDELTIDDFSKRHFRSTSNDPNREYKRTTNYLLQNLILSENFTRGPVVDDTIAQNLLEPQRDKGAEVQGAQKGENAKTKTNKVIRLEIRTNDGCYTGRYEDEHFDNDYKKQREVEKIKLAFSKLTIALPGSVMSIHAFFNVIENFIRNSAKYKKEDFKEELVVTIAIKELSGKTPVSYEFVIYDNKENAYKPCSDGKENMRTLLEQMKYELGELKILNDKNELDKSNKGLKEMLFSTLWMRAYTYEKQKYMSDILAEMDRLDSEAKLKEIKSHAFEYVAVNDKGEIVDRDPEHKSNLGIHFELPKYRMLENVCEESLGKLNDNLIEKGLNNFSDILCVNTHYDDKDPKTGKPIYPALANLKTVFTRVYEGNVKDEDDAKGAVEILKGVLRKRFPNFDEYRIGMGSKEEKGFGECNTKQRGIYFESHLMDLKKMKDYAYSEAVSGENFTKTMEVIFNNSFKVEETGVFKDETSEYFALKIKEAALTRITLVDERLYNDMVSHDKEEYLTNKNIRILTLFEESKKNRIEDSAGTDSEEKIAETSVQQVCSLDSFFVGNGFKDDKNATHFLSIHLGMIEKIVKSDSGWVKARGLQKETLETRVKKLMEELKGTFKTKEEELFIAVHSGRGNFSKELDEPLEKYPFISISAIESVYANSKFLLAQLFYSTVYIGKGVANKSNDKEANK